MLFNSIHFILFFLLVIPAYFVMPHKYRWMLLLAASCYFYMCFIPVYILILGFTIVIDYLAGLWIEGSTGKKRKRFLALSLVANILVLAVFKYYNFLNGNLSAVLNVFGYSNHLQSLGMLLPIGLSFHTFQAMSYTIEVYRGHQKAERHFGMYALYVMFFPQLVAGPIERPQNLLHQFYEKHSFDAAQIVQGLKLMLWGFFMKLVIADRLAIYVNSVYNFEGFYQGKTLALATFFFAIQIYCDFAGYSNIAIGAARIMGFNLMTNFNRPYFSRSIAEFWKRWHISLSTWFKDYLYISLGGNRVSIPRWYFNLLLVFVVSGLWHGASWTFIIWGALNGFYLVFALITQKPRNTLSRITSLDQLPQLKNFLNVLLTFLLVCFSWIFFRANHVHEGFDIARKIFAFDGPLYYESPGMLAYCVLAVLLLFAIELGAARPAKFAPVLNSRYWLVRNLSYVFLVMVILMAGVFDGAQFIYFQF